MKTLAVSSFALPVLCAFARILPAGAKEKGGKSLVEPGEVVRLVHGGSSAVVDTYGALLTSWLPAGGEEVFAMAKSRDKWPAGEQIHGGLPIYWPWFVFEGPEGCRIHGVTGYAQWQIKERTADSVVLSLDDTEDTRRVWPYRFHAEMEYRLGEKLSAAFRVTNTGEARFAATEGIHPYFRVGDTGKCTVTGTDGARYYWKGEAEKGDRRVWEGDFPCNRVATGKPGFVFEEKSPEGVHVHDLVDPVLGRTLRISYEGSIKLVIWNSGPDFSKFGGSDDPDYGRRFVCVEGAALYRDRAYTLQPGETHSLKLSIEPIEPVKETK